MITEATVFVEYKVLRLPSVVLRTKRSEIDAESIPYAGEVLIVFGKVYTFLL